MAFYFRVLRACTASDQETPGCAVLNQEVNRQRRPARANPIADQLQRHMQAGFRRDQEVRFSGLFRDGLHVHILRLALVVFRLEVAGTAENHRRDLLRHMDRRLELWPQVQRRHLRRVDGDRRNARLDGVIGSEQTQWKQHYEREKPGKSHFQLPPVQ